ncbi:hypothetical protein OIU34_16845 [Pararhizobium sp. BT-229]|uniref:hypothetical protein n=1 Tax=Pararhizobium sp. BT-229 TaxID=2986923 RepID=UPI0021F6F823|nr:hypothetical protein [Pararhizobium sp. BT-229]MCV9963573.1 hypothetical protein [Pararhizobium sp. BT-229]
MIFSATIPVAITGTRVGFRHRGTRRYTFWQEFDITVKSVKSEAAPLIASWDAAFDERLVHRTSRNDWGTYPSDGQQHVRFHEGAYWRQVMQSDVIEGSLSSPVLDAGAFSDAFDKPEWNLFLSQAPLPTVGRGKPVVRDMGEYIELVNSWHDDYKSYNALTAKIEAVGKMFLAVDDTVYIRCGEPMIELSDCVVVDRAGNVAHLLRVSTDKKECKWRAEKTPHRLFPLLEFDEALAAAPEAKFDRDFGVDRATGVDFNEIRRPHIARPDLLTGLDYRSFQSLCELRRFFNQIELTDPVDHHGGTARMAERTRLHMLLGAAINDYDKGNAEAFGNIEDLLPSLHAAWHGTFVETLTEKVIALLDERPIFLPHVPGGPKP